MQLSGGYRYPGSALCFIFTIVAVGATLTASGIRSLSAGTALVLFLSLEGTVLLASAFSPTGLTPPPRGLIARMKWFFAQQAGVPVQFSQPLFCGGLLALFLSALLGALLSAPR